MVGEGWETCCVVLQQGSVWQDSFEPGEANTRFADSPASSHTAQARVLGQ